MTPQSKQILIFSLINGLVGAVIFAVIFREIDVIHLGEANKFTKDFLFQAAILGHVASLIGLEFLRKQSNKESGTSPLTVKSNFLKSLLYAPVSFVILGLPIYFVSTELLSASMSLLSAAAVKFVAGFLITTVMMLIAVRYTQKTVQS